MTITVLVVATATGPATAQQYPDGRPSAALRMNAKDHGIVLRHGDGPGQCDALGARDVWVFEDACVQRTLGIARTKDLDGPWTVDPHPVVPIEEQIENSTLYFEESNGTWFLFTNHIGIERGEFTDAIWVYWSKDLNRWDPDNKAVVLDGRNCTWSRKCIGLPSVVPVGRRLALFYDAPGADSTSHMRRQIGLAWLELPLSPPQGSRQDLVPAQSKES